MKQALGWFAGLVGVFALGWILVANSTAMQAVFAPKQEQIRRNVFTQSQAYNDGVAQDLNGMRRDYALADSTGKAMLVQVIRHRLANYDTNKLPADLRSFVTSLPQ